MVEQIQQTPGKVSPVTPPSTIVKKQGQFVTPAQGEEEKKMKWWYWVVIALAVVVVGVGIYYLFF
ncbi:MAG: hypothetical protein KKF68_01165 [Nanoarchaeota archaeon]|nr:hypothetical protein [Nanoarchaeota archaeon]